MTCQQYFSPGSNLSFQKICRSGKSNPVLSSMSHDLQSITQSFQIYSSPKNGNSCHLMELLWSMNALIYLVFSSREPHSRWLANAALASHTRQRLLSFSELELNCSKISHCFVLLMRTSWVWVSFQFSIHNAKRQDWPGITFFFASVFQTREWGMLAVEILM